MNIKKFIIILGIFIWGCTDIHCPPSDIEDESSPTWNVLYKVTGVGAFTPTAVYSVGGGQCYPFSPALPWTQNITTGEGTIGLYVSCTNVTNGDSVTASIYVDGNLSKTETQNAYYNAGVWSISNIYLTVYVP